MNFDANEVETAYYGLSGFIRERTLAHRPVPPEVRNLVQRLDFHVRMSGTRPETGCDAEQLTRSEAWIGTRQVADMLSMTPRHVQRIADQLGGKRISPRVMVFRESEVIAFMEGRTHDRTDPGGGTATS